VRNRQITERIPAGRWGDPKDFAGPVVFLASAASQYVCGELLVVDGVKIIADDTTADVLTPLIRAGWADDFSVCGTDSEFNRIDRSFAVIIQCVSWIPYETGRF